MVPDVLPTLKVPQPAQGLPSQVPNQPPEPNAFDAINAAAPAAPAQKQPAPAAKEPENFFDKINPEAPNGSFDSMAQPQWTSKINQGGFSHANIRIPNPQGIQEDVGGSAMDLAKVHMARTQEDQKKILTALHPQSKPAVENGYLTYEENGVRKPFDGASLNVVKNLAQLSGKGLNFAVQGLSQMGATVAGGALGPIGGIAGYELGLPLSAYLGDKAQDYLTEKWGKVKPDEAGFKEDVKNAMLINTVAGNLLPFFANRLSAYQLSQIDTAALSKSMNQGAEQLIESIHGGPIPKDSLNTSTEAGQNVMGFHDGLHQSIGDQLGRAKGQIIADSQGAYAQTPKTIATLEKVIKEFGHGSVTFDKNGYAKFSDGSQVTAVNDGFHITGPAPFSNGVEGGKAMEKLIGNYNSILASHRNASMGGLQLHDIDRFTQEYQAIANFQPIEGMPLRPGEFSDRKIQGAFARVGHSMSEERLDAFKQFAKDPELKASIEGIYSNYSSKIDSLDMINRLIRESQMNPETLANAIVRPDKAEYLKAFKSMTANGNEDVFKQVRNAWINKAYNASHTPGGSFDLQKFNQQLSGLGEQTSSLMFEKPELMRMKSDARMMGRIDAVKPGDDSTIRAIARFASYVLPIKAAGRFVVGGASSKFLSALSKNPDVFAAVAGKGMDSVIANSSQKQIFQAVMLQKNLKNFMLSNKAALAVSNPLATAITKQQMDQIDRDGGPMSSFGTKP